jgi:alpha-ketoglutarate-dependent taurine dioxygenase
MLTQIDEAPSAWRADTLDAPPTWYYALSSRALSALNRSLEAWRQGAAAVTALRASDTVRALCAVDLQPVRRALETGRGFAIVRPGPPMMYSPADLQAMYWLIGQCLGRPVEQNTQRTLLYDVRDTGQDVRHGARFSVTHAESTFHTDNSFGAEVLDYVGLLCLNPAKSGGESQLVNGHSVLNELDAVHPWALTQLRRPFHFVRRGGVPPGEQPTVAYPVVSGRNWRQNLLLRYLRYWIDVGHEQAGLPLSAEQTQALDLFDGLTAERRLRAEFTLRPGEMLFVNNRWILHNRSAFEDHDEPERKRHYVRLWLRRGA